ncbi:MAG: kelch motif-containing protein, partial [Verrucomicrobiales bacterium]|nr:kelch motif-containing protein [Verrucomicrobiales bacterium]
AGSESTGIPTNALVYKPALAPSPSPQPQIDASAPIELWHPVSITGSGFQGLTTGSCGQAQDSASDYPLLQLRSLENGQTAFLPLLSWSSNSLQSVPLINFPPGHALMTVFVNAIPSPSKMVEIRASFPMIRPMPVTNGQFQLGFTYTPRALPTVLATTNVSTPLTNWAVLPGVVETSPGEYQFSDTQAGSKPLRFYSLRLPPAP